MQLTETIGRALALMRETSGLTQEQLGERMGITGASVSRLESRTGNPRASSIARYLDALGLGFSDLAVAMRQLDGEMPPPVEVREPEEQYPELDELAARGAEVFRDLADALRRAKR